MLFAVTVNTGQKTRREDNTIFKMVDVREYIRPEPEPEKKVEKEEVTEVKPQEDIAEKIMETDKEVHEIEINYLPHNKVTKLPVLPGRKIRSRIIYPVLAKKKGITGVVYLNIYIDKTGKIMKVEVVKEPGYGLGDAAVKALEGIRCVPAGIDGVTVPVIYRYAVNFTLKK